MFAKSDKTPRGASAERAVNMSPQKPSGTVSVISSDLKVLGDLESAGDVVVDGMVEGDVRSKNLTIGQAAHITGSVFAQNVTIAGKITGRVRANNVTINKSAQVLGDIAHENLAIEAGAHLEGRFSREDFTKSEGADKPAAAKPAKQASGGNGLATSAAKPGASEVGIAAAAGR